MRLKPCDSLDALEPVLAGDRDALVFKHSTRCPVSRRARGEVEAFAREVPDAEVIEILVVESRPVSLGFAERTGVRHESPQAILMRAGKPVWNDSHLAITKAALEKAWSA